MPDGKLRCRAAGCNEDILVEVDFRPGVAVLTCSICGKVSLYRDGEPGELKAEAKPEDAEDDELNPKGYGWGV
jgi:hypothetical protein